MGVCVEEQMVPICPTKGSSTLEQEFTARGQVGRSSIWIYFLSAWSWLLFLTDKPPFTPFCSPRDERIWFCSPNQWLFLKLLPHPAVTSTTSTELHFLTLLARLDEKSLFPLHDTPSGLPPIATSQPCSGPKGLQSIFIVSETLAYSCPSGGNKMSLGKPGFTEKQWPAGRSQPRTPLDPQVKACLFIQHISGLLAFW